MKNITTSIVLFLLAGKLIQAQSTLYWTKTYNAPNNGVDKAIAVTTDANCFVYVTGTTQSISTGIDYLTIKYDATGNIVWQKTYDGTGGDDEPVAIAVDAAGNVYVTGKSQGNGTAYDFATVKYDANGNLQWGGAKRFNNTNPGGNGDDVAVTLKLDAQGQYVYVGGYSYNYVNSSSDNDYLVIKYNATNGNTLSGFPTAYNEPAALNNKLTAMQVDGSGNIYVTGSVVNSSIPSGFWATVKYNSAGVQQAFVGEGTQNLNAPSDLVVDGSGNVYVIGNEPSQYNISVYKYPSGLVLSTWHKYFNVYALGINQNNGQYSYHGGQITVGNNALYFYANIDVDQTVNTHNYDVLCVKLNPSTGDTIWTKRFGTSSDDWCNSMSLDATGNVYLTGYTISGGNKNIFIQKYSSGGSIAPGYPITYNGVANADDEGSQVIVTAENNIVLTGYTTGNSSQEDFFTRKYVSFIPTANVGSNTSVCQGLSVQIGGATTAGYSYNWAPSSTLSSSSVSNPYASPTAQTTYHLTVTAGCAVDSATVTVTVNPIPVSPVISQSGDTLTSSASQGNQWYLNGNILPGATDTTYIITQPGLYEVVVTNNYGCSSTSNSITVTGLEQVNEKRVSISPNPSNGTFYLRFQSQLISASILITDINGRTILAKEITNVLAALPQAITLPDIAKGVYFLHLKAGEQIVTQKLVVE